jgi:hypothetical protein
MLYIQAIAWRLGRGIHKDITLWATGRTNKPYPHAPDINIE